MANGYSPYVVSDIKTLPGEVRAETKRKEKESKASTLKQKKSLLDMLREKVDKMEEKARKAKKKGEDKGWFGDLFGGELGGLFDKVGITDAIADLEKGIFKNPMMRSMILGPLGSAIYELAANYGGQKALAGEYEKIHDEMDIEGLGGTWLEHEVKDIEKDFAKITAPTEAKDWLAASILPAAGSWGMSQLFGGESILKGANFKPFQQVGGKWSAPGVPSLKFEPLKGLGKGFKHIGQNLGQSLRPGNIIENMQNANMFEKMAMMASVVPPEKLQSLSSMLTSDQEEEGRDPNEEGYTEQVVSDAETGFKRARQY